MEHISNDLGHSYGVEHLQELVAFCMVNCVMSRDGVARLVERQTQDLKTEGSNPVRSTRKICESFSESKMLC